MTKVKTTKTTKVIKKEVKKDIETPIKPETSDTLPFRLEITVNDITFKTEGESVKKCLIDFIDSPLYPFGAKTKMFITCFKGKLKRHRIFNTKEARKVLLTMSQKDTAVEILANKLIRELE